MDMAPRTRGSIHVEEGAANLDIISKAIRRDKGNADANGCQQTIWPRIRPNSEITGRQ